jgi:hypothetical protein
MERLLADLSAAATASVAVFQRVNLLQVKNNYYEVIQFITGRK